MSANDEAAIIEQIKKVHVAQLVAEACSSLLSVGYVRVGGMPEAQDAIDLPQARLAIEAVTALIRVLEPSVPPAALQNIKSALADLQLGYAEQAKATGAPPPNTAPPAGPPPPGRGPQAVRRPPPAPQRPKIWTPGGEV